MLDTYSPMTHFLLGLLRNFDRYIPIMWGDHLLTSVISHIHSKRTGAHETYYTYPAAKKLTFALPDENVPRLSIPRPYLNSKIWFNALVWLLIYYYYNYSILFLFLIFYDCVIFFKKATSLVMIGIPMRLHVK